MIFNSCIWFSPLVLTTMWNSSTCILWGFSFFFFKKDFEKEGEKEVESTQRERK